MATLYERFYRYDTAGDSVLKVNPEEIADVLLSLCNAAEDGQLVQASPENIEISEDGVVFCTSVPYQNLYYAAPEEIIGNVSHKNSRWFTFGLLMYFVMTGHSFYQDNHIRLVDLPELIHQGSGLIQEDTVPEDALDAHSLLKKAIEKFTAWEPGRRIKGIPLLLNAVKQYVSVVNIDYVSNGQIVASEKKTIMPPSLEMRAGTLITGTGGRQYRVAEMKKIAFRPGTHRCQIPVVDDRWS